MCRIRALIVAGAVLAPAVAAAEDTSPGTRLAEQMIDAYQDVESYHARWVLLAEGEAGEVSRSEVEIAFDRSSGMLLVRRQACGEGGGAVLPEGELLVSDGQRIRVAQRLDWSAPPSTERIDPDAVTYWVIERTLTFQPIDLPLLLGESPLLGWLHMTGGTIDAPADPQADGDALREFQITAAAESGCEGETVDAQLDGASFIRQATAGRRKFTFLLESLSINEPLSRATFDFEAQAAFLGAGESRVRVDPS